MEKTISTIIPFYNSGSNLGRMLDSILAGTLIPDEIILIDDGSTDDSASIANSYCADHNCIHYYRQEHAGVSAARNLGMSLATGEWISFLDSDDYIEPNMYEELLQAATSGDYQGAICGFFTHKDGIVTPYTPQSSKPVTSNEMLSSMFTDDNVKGFLFTRLFRADVIKDLCFDKDIRLCEDLLFQTGLFAKKEVSFVSIPHPLYHYIINSSSVTASRNMFDNGQFIYEAAYNKIKAMVQIDAVLKSYNSILEYSMYTLLSCYKSDGHTKENLKQIRMLQKELSKTPCSKKTKRRILYEHAPLLASLFL